MTTKVLDQARYLTMCETRLEDAQRLLLQAQQDLASRRLNADYGLSNESLEEIFHIINDGINSIRWVLRAQQPEEEK